MAAQGKDRESGGGLLGAIVAAFSYMAATVALVWEKATSDGHLDAFIRQGADEIGTALKAFPGSIQVDEPGTIWNPTQGEIAANRKSFYQTPGQVEHGHGLYGGDHGQESATAHGTRAQRTPGEIAADAGHGLGGGSVHGQERQRTPGEIAADRSPYMPPLDRGHDQSLGY